MQRALPIYHDRGGQYGGRASRALLRPYGAVRLQSRRGDCYDNAQAENRLEVLGAAGPASKRNCSNYASDPFLLTWPMPKPVSPNILTTVITTDCTPASAIRPRIPLTNNCLKLPP